MTIDSSRLGNAPETLSKTGGPARFARQRVAVRVEAGAHSASGARLTVPITWLLALMTVTRPSRPSSAPSLWVSGRGSSAGFSARNWVTYTFLPSAVMAMPCGFWPTF